MIHIFKISIEWFEIFNMLKITHFRGLPWLETMSIFCKTYIDE